MAATNHRQLAGPICALMVAGAAALSGCSSANDEGGEAPGTRSVAQVRQGLTLAPETAGFVAKWVQAPSGISPTQQHSLSWTVTIDDQSSAGGTKFICNQSGQQGITECRPNAVYSYPDLIDPTDCPSPEALGLPFTDVNCVGTAQSAQSVWLHTVPVDPDQSTSKVRVEMDVDGVFDGFTAFELQIANGSGNVSVLEGPDTFGYSELDEQCVTMQNGGWKFCYNFCNSSAKDLCDGLDNDCDGLIDEDFPHIELPCGEGACTSTVTISCVDGHQVSSACVPETSPTPEIPDGIDNDCDGETDECVGDCEGCGPDGNGSACLLKFLFVGMCYEGDDAQFAAETQGHVDFLAEATELDVCANSIHVDRIPLADLELAPDCDPDYFIGNFSPDLANALSTLGVDEDDYSAVVAFTNDDDFPANNESAPDGLVFPGNPRAFVRHRSPIFIGTATGNEYHLIPESTFAHEFGHFLGLNEEYLNRPSAINPVDPALGCNPDDGSCCDPYVVDGQCYIIGNRVRPGNSGVGRCIMSDPLAGVAPDAPPVPRGWCDHCWNHIVQNEPIKKEIVPLTCASAVTLDGPILDLSGALGMTGLVRGLNAEFDPSGVTDRFIPGVGDTHLRLEHGGTSIFEARFDPAAYVYAPLRESGPPTIQVEEQLFRFRIPSPEGVDPTDEMVLVVAQDGVDVSRSTVNGEAPIAQIATDTTVECDAGGASVALLGAGSSDPDGDTIVYEWTGPGVTFDDPSSSAPTAQLPIGSSEITLTVTDGTGLAGSNSVEIDVLDTLAPEFSVDELSDVFVRSCDLDAHMLELEPPSANDQCDGSTSQVTGVVTASSNPALSLPLTLDGGSVSLPVGVHTIEWVAEDGSGNASEPLVQMVSVGAAIHATDSVFLRNEDTTIDGGVVNTGTGQTLLEIRTHTGDIASVANVELLREASADFVLHEGQLDVDTSNGASVAGSQLGSVAVPGSLDLSGVTFPSPTGGDIIVNSGQTAAFAPGSYASANVDGTLFLSAGEYFFQSLTVNAAAEVVVEEGVAIYAQGIGNLQGSFVNEPGGSLAEVFLGFTGSTLNVQTNFSGILVAPNAKVDFGTSDAQAFSGMFHVRTLDVRNNATLTCQVLPCTSPVCQQTAASSCSDGEKNGGESGVDCGGACPACSGSECPSGEYEAETMFHSTGGSTAGGWNIWANGYISATHDFSDGAATLWITAKGQRGGGTWPHMRVLVGGQLIDDFNVASADWTTYPVGVSDVVGTQEIRIEFDNDYYGGAGNDRNLLVDKLVVDCSSAETLSAYAFETDVMGWTNVSAPGTGSSVSSAQAFDGNSSLALSVFGWGDPTIDVAPTTSPAAGSTITVRVFVPSGAPINAVSPYVLDANWHWTDGYADSFSTGQWQTFTVVVPNDAVLPLNRIGVKFYESAPYTGDLYIDAVEW